LLAYLVEAILLVRVKSLIFLLCLFKMPKEQRSQDYLKENFFYSINSNLWQGARFIPEPEEDCNPNGPD
jgi:hypothetical protein